MKLGPFSGSLLFLYNNQDVNDNVGIKSEICDSVKVNL